MSSSRRILSAFCAALITLVLIPTIASAIPRDEVVSRGNVWVQRKVPYSQAHYASIDGRVLGKINNGTGYRMDCSGFISMCWNLRYPDGRLKSLDTAGLDMDSLVVPVAKAGLQAGDLMLRAKDRVTGGGHAVLFIDWADETHAYYWAYEEKGSDSGTIKSKRNYATDYTKSFFRPYRYRGISPDFADVQERVSGLDRYETAVAAVERSFPASDTTSVPVAVIASGENWPDALGGAALAGVQEGPLLLTARGSLPWATRASLVRLKPESVVILGGTATVSTAVESQIASMGIPVTRIGGANRYEVSNSVARATIAQVVSRSEVVDTVYLATGLSFPDALAVSPIAARTHRPILLTGTDSLRPGTFALLKELSVKNVVILGGTGSVSDKVAKELIAGGFKVSRIGGADRYAASINIAHHGKQQGLGISWRSLGLANGSAFADALSGGVAQGQSGEGALLVLTRGDRLTEGVAHELGEHRAEILAEDGRLRVFGGSGTVLQGTRSTAAAVLRAK